MPSKLYSRNKRGFTLIEVLVSLTIMASITAVAFAGLSIGIDTWQRGSRKIEELDRTFALERLLNRQVAVADPQLFLGGVRELEFVSTYSLANGSGDPVRVKYWFDSGKLLYAEMPAADYSSEAVGAVINQTIGSFSQISFRYLGRDQGGQAAWVSEWTQNGLPPAVQVQIGSDVLTIPTVNRPVVKQP
jgi:prepilin-type N-terminal cleavage/methylation domain-containing protein